jgi:hypothetical protein
VQLFHGGVFIGDGIDRIYVDAKTVWYDFCEMDKWSPLVMEDIVEDLGYEMTRRIKVYWLLPEKSINNDGLVLIKKDADTNNMISMVQFGHKFLDMYLDHDDSLNAYKWYDVVASADTQPPQALHHSKRELSRMQSSRGTIDLGNEELQSDIDSDDPDYKKLSLYGNDHPHGIILRRSFLTQAEKIL